MSRTFRISVVFLGSIFFILSRTALNAQSSSLDELPGLRERAVVLNIISRIVEQNQQVVWNNENTSITIPGRPVGLKLVGTDLVVAVLFTPFIRQNGRYTLVAQGQIWINVPDEGMSYHTTIQTIPLEFGEEIYFFPLGSMETRDEASIEIKLVLEPYRGNPGGSRQDRESPPVPGSRPNRFQGERAPRNNAGEEGNIPLP